MKRRARFWAIPVLALACLLVLGGRIAVPWFVAKNLKASESSEYFAADIARFATADRDLPPPAHPIVFVGSSSIRLWDTLQQDMAPLPVLNRGFGGARLSSVVHFVDRVVVQYRPRAVVLYAGDNDLDASVPPEALVRDFRRFVSMCSLPCLACASTTCRSNPTDGCGAIGQGTSWPMRADLRDLRRRSATGLHRRRRATA